MRTLLPRAGRRVLLASATVIALAAAGVAIADHGAPATTTLASATFSATTPAGSHSNTCTPAAPADAFTSTDAMFTGTVTGATDPRLNGPVTIHVRSDYDTTKNVGSLKGDMDIQSSTSPPPFHGHVHLRLTAVNANGAVQGWLDGNLGDGTRLRPTTRRSSRAAAAIRARTGTTTSRARITTISPPSVGSGRT